MSVQQTVTGGQAGMSHSRDVPMLGVALVCTGLIALFFWNGLAHAAVQWEREEFSYGYIVPPLTVLMVWHALRTMTPKPSGGVWAGAAVIILAVLSGVLAKVGGMPVFSYYGFILALMGLAMVLYGWHGLRHLFFPLFYLFFALPLPNTLYIKVSTTMQYISSVLGTEILKAMNYSVYLSGNIIDLGPYQLQVAEACNGLRYLFPLASFAFLIGYLYKGPTWHKVVLFLFTVPITIVINSARIAFTGILVNSNGVSAAEGFMHAFEGWVIFVIGLVLLFLVQQGLILVSGSRELLTNRIDLDMIMPARGRPAAPTSRATWPLGVASAVLLAGVVALVALPEGARSVPPRKPLATFPLQIDQWTGVEQSILPSQIDILQVDDYLVADYASPAAPRDVNLYIAWYDAQDRRAAIHSPAVCIPAGGWEVTNFTTTTVQPTGLDDSLEVNRSVIAQGTSRQLVYYWFELRHRRMTHEYSIKLANVWDALTLGRTDGALIRLVTPVAANESLEDAEQRLSVFMGEMLPHLDDYVPN
ncbi:VPLPA-CTERM-specific exosortase XrtD [Roseospira navarrensis]|uniref:VPLPA-CTERM-specific exosortase XrtD n=1 Tax=Roseospira navarrensis TaxID=140058 RepID=A0A7X2D244_9PROT|nr:VPLPA-CTERM-specific exosortase XrtD [Roseospira navarrensis]MQX35363.1 VPLPA-CTERM-specific exosortase XrtD [Roseospira navarrensis]